MMRWAKIRFRRVRSGVSRRIGKVLLESSLIRDFRNVRDVDAMARCLTAQVFRKNIDPRPLDLDGSHRILVLAPHQDDELIGAGGLLVLARQKGAEARVIFLTDGGGDPSQQLAPNADPEIRSREAKAVCGALQCSYVELGIPNKTMDVTVAQFEQLQSEIQGWSPSHILSPWVFDAADKHRFCNQLLAMALQRVDLATASIVGYQVNNSIFANRFLEITDSIEEKISLLQLYRSQNEYLRRYDHIAKGLGAWNSRILPSKSELHRERYVELFSVMDKDEFLEVARTFFSEPAKVFDRAMLVEKLKNLERNVRT